MNRIKTLAFLVFYKTVVKPALFLFDAEVVHNALTRFGESLGNANTGRAFTKRLFHYENRSLNQKIAGISFDNPIGLSAGFDYDARLAGIVGSVGFGLSTVGTVTNIPYEGNPAPRLGRLPKSKSLLVNKGFKSEGADAVVHRLAGRKFDTALGISIGRSNSPALENLEQSIEDIVAAFRKFEKAGIANSYYEINISCPNLIHGSEEITFYPPKNLERLLTKLDKLALSKPLLVKMPISEDNGDFSKMLDVIVKHKVAGVVVGNLQKDRKDSSFDKNEIKAAGKGNFSGKPCSRRSNELIALAYRKYGTKLVIVGCGGVFDARDAYEKIKLGASLIMMITGLVYEGPQVVGQINRELVGLLKQDGYGNISEAVGAYHA